MTDDQVHDDGFDETDEFVRGVRDGYIARSDAVFDFAAGLADVHRRAGLTEGDLCARIDALASLLDAVERLQGPATGDVRRAREGLFALRHAVTARPRPRAEVEQLLGTVADHLDRADRVLRDRRGMSLDGMIRQSLGDVLDRPVDTASELRTLRGRITAGFGLPQDGASARPWTRGGAAPEAGGRHRS
ncbi:MULTISPECIES: hypothetical protein [Streptacidiphilus]|uniref:Uncharacterized protein n=1 Tax=Streptacidiphilus cavernicola TaxID=3342716 RepID=A0ABV6UZ82_9ACTN|nr:hypothetical protein [Streptacidiphilus jeojiense]